MFCCQPTILITSFGWLPLRHHPPSSRSLLYPLIWILDSGVKCANVSYLQYNELRVFQLTNERVAFIAKQCKHSGYICIAISMIATESKFSRRRTKQQGKKWRGEKNGDCLSQHKSASCCECVFFIQLDIRVIFVFLPLATFHWNGKQLQPNNS